jgi:hypothetical protein
MPWGVPHLRIDERASRPMWGAVGYAAVKVNYKHWVISRIQDSETTFDVMFHESMDLGKIKINPFAQPPCLAPYKHLEEVRGPQVDEHNFEFLLKITFH